MKAGCFTFEFQLNCHVRRAIPQLGGDAAKSNRSGYCHESPSSRLIYRWFDLLDAVIVAAHPIRVHKPRLRLLPRQMQWTHVWPSLLRYARQALPP